MEVKLEFRDKTEMDIGFLAMFSYSQIMLEKFQEFIHSNSILGDFIYIRYYRKVERDKKRLRQQKKTKRDQVYWL